MTILELEELLKKEESFVLAIDGMCASGKTTLATYLHHQLGGNLFHMDDFFLPQDMRTDTRLSTPGGNVHYERFLETVLLPLSLHQDVEYQRFDCHRQDYDSKMIMPYQKRNIIEGSYALHPHLLPYYSHMIVLKISPTLQLERIKLRNPHQIEQFQNVWIPLENHYIRYYHLFENYPVIEDIHIPPL